MTFDPRYLRGIEHFNRREFFEAHEVWEDLWREEKGDAHRFLQGLIQLATSLHHFTSSNIRGARILYETGVSLLRPYGPEYWKLPIPKLIEDMTRCVAGILPYEAHQLPGYMHPHKEKFPVKIQTELIPNIELVP